MVLRGMWGCWGGWCRYWHQIMAEDRVFCLVKFGKKEHMENLLNWGEVCFTALTLFRDSLEQERGDSFEAAFSLKNVILKEIKCEHPTAQNLQFKDGAINYHDYSVREKYELSFFDKNDQLKHQEEYRIILKLDSYKERHLIRIGSIKDYSEIVKSKDLIEMIWEAKRELS